MSCRVLLVCVVVASCVGVTLEARMLSGTELVTAMRQGGYVLVMRHASSPAQPPDARAADKENTTRERQLDEKGRQTATAMGEAVRRLGIPVGEVDTSPTYRARETARLAGLPSPTPITELGDAGKSMQAAGAKQADWLKHRVAQTPAHGTNVVLITHQPNISAAFPSVSPATSDGEMLVFQPDGNGGATLVGRIKIDEWPGLHR
jgi:phosphohistidine phosphatase SixA